MRTLSLKVDIEEEAAIRQRMAKAGDKSLSAYLRRVALEGGYDLEYRLGRMQRQMDLLTEALERQQGLIVRILDNKNDQLELKLLAGVYQMVYSSVDPAVQTIADRHTDAAGIDVYLEGQAKAEESIGKHPYRQGRKKPA